MAEITKKPRYIYEYLNERAEVPDRFVYQVHKGGYDINEAFFTWAFNKHEISIVDIQILYAGEDRTVKGNKEQTAASSTFFIASVKGRDKRKVEKVGDGESGNESITNFQRGYPAGLAIKRAKVNMGKEFFNLVDLKSAMDCRDTVVEFGADKGKTLEELAKTSQGMNTIRWFASDKFTGDGNIKHKAQMFIELYGGGVGGSTPNPSNNGNSVSNHYQNNVTTAVPQQGNMQSQQVVPNQNQQVQLQQNQPVQMQQNHSIPQIQMMSQEQKDMLGLYRKKKFLTDLQITTIANELFGTSFTWKTATYEQGQAFIQRLNILYGSIN